MLLPSVDALQEFNVDRRPVRRGVRPRHRADQRLDQVGHEPDPRHRLRVRRATRRSTPRTTSIAADRPIPPFRRNQYGVTVGGPVVMPKLFNGRDRLFFMFNWEGLRETQGADRDAVGAADRLAHRRFLEPARRERQPDPDLRSGHARLRRRRQRHPGADAVPGQRHSGQPHPSDLAAAARLLSAAAARSAPARNFVNDEARRVDADQFTYRLDFTQSSNASWFFRHSISHELGYDPFAIPNMGINTDTDVQQAALGYTRTFGSNKLNDLRVRLRQPEERRTSRRAPTPTTSSGASASTCRATIRSTGACRTSASPGCRASARRATRRSSTTTRRFSSWTTSRGPSASTRSSSAASCGACATTRSAASSRAAAGRSTAATRRTRCCRRPSAAARRSPTSCSATSTAPRGRSARRSPTSARTTSRSTPRTAGRSPPNLTINYGLRWEYDQPFNDKNDAIVNIDFDWANTHEPVFVRAGTGDPVRRQSGVPARARRPVRARRAVRPRRLSQRLQRLRAAARHRLDGHAEDGACAAGGGIYYVRDIGNAVFDTVRNAPFTIRRDEPAETFRPNLSFEQPFARTGAPTFILATQWDEPSIVRRRSGRSACSAS